MLGSIAPDQRDKALIADAFTRAAVESGSFADVEVDRVADYAGVTVAELHDHFDDLDQCSLVSLERFLTRLHDHMDDARVAGDSWPEQVKASIDAGVEFLMEVESVSRLFLVQRTSPAAMELRLNAIRKGASALRRARAEYPRAAHYPEIMEQTLVSGVVLVVAETVLAEEASLSECLSRELVELVLTPYIGRSEASRISAG